MQLSPKSRLADPDAAEEEKARKAASTRRIDRAQQYRESVHYPRYLKSLDWPPRQIKVGPRRSYSGSTPFNVWKDGIHHSFGIGICSYFRMLRNMGLLAFICGILNLPSAIYYGSHFYSVSKSQTSEGVSAFELGESKEQSFLLTNTAVCGDYIPVCLDESCRTYAANCFGHDYYADIIFGEKVATCEDYSDGTWVSEYKHKFLATNVKTPVIGHRECDLLPMQGYLDLAMTITVMLSLSCMARFDKRHAEEVSKVSPTITSYSVCMENPDSGAADPQHWSDYFSQFGEVVSVTVCKKNGRLLQLLGRKIALEERMRKLGGPDIDISEAVKTTPEPRYSDILRRCGLIALCPYEVQVRDLKQKIVHHANEGLLATSRFGVSKIYVVFNKEIEMRRCLNHIKYFRLGSLRLTQAVPPNAIMHINLEVSQIWRCFMCLLSALIMIALCYLCFVVLKFCLHHRLRVLVSILVFAFSELLPFFTRILVDLERHETLNGYESSYLLKSVPTHWFTTCFAPWLISTFTEHADTHVMYHIMDVLLLYAVIKPLIRALDPIGAFKRKVLARFAPTDAAAKALYGGRNWILTERFVDITTNLMLVLIYGSVIPLGYFVLAAACCIAYWADKYCLFRIYREIPPSNEHLDLQIYVYLLISVGIHIIFTLWFLATWPFDQLCRTYDLDDRGWWIANEYGLDKESAWKMCDQNFFSAKNFHTGDHSWWTTEQKNFIDQYIILLMTIGSLVTLYFAFKLVHALFFRDEYAEARKKFSELASHANLSVYNLPETHERAYIPHLNIPDIDEPMRCAYTAGVDFDWNDDTAPRDVQWEDGKGNAFYDDSLKDIEVPSKRVLFSSVTIFKRLSRKEDEGKDEDGDTTDEQKDDRTNSEKRTDSPSAGTITPSRAETLKSIRPQNAMNSTRERTSPSLSDSPGSFSQSSERDGSVGETELANPLFKKVYKNMGVSSVMWGGL